MKLKIRCPQCTKLYQVTSEDIQNDTPLFQCISCESHFSFEYPPQDPSNVLCFTVSLDKANIDAVVQSKVSTEPGQQEMKSCPKCGALNGRRAKECYSCHVIFEKLEGLPVDPSLKAQPSLVRKWKNVVENFDRSDLHDEFIRSCQQLDALKFAAYKYEELKKAQGGDPQCDQMIARINTMVSASLFAKRAPEHNKPKWQKYVFWAPFAISALLILIGMTNLGHRNLIGVGVALACMTVGLVVMIKGKISVSDFLD